MKYLLLATTLLATIAQAGTSIELSAEASRPAANDMVEATVYAEASGSNPAELARKLNQDVAEALKLIKSRPSISVKSGQQSTYPVYSQNQKIDSWRMRSELILESGDQAAVSELLGRLQQMRLAVGNLAQRPAPATRQAAEDEATRQAVGAFQNRAKLLADLFGKPYQVKQLSVQQNGSSPPMPMFRASLAKMATDAAPMPMEAGNSLVTTTVSGQIELAD
ncbi:MAG: SIMPL domain-containing protein [Azonexus sp.]|nr:SIMPL domain-containing protein [Azonexus sp.]